MNDSEILDWIQEHLCSFRQTLQPISEDSDDCLYEMEWMDDNMCTVPNVRGVSLRDCVQKAIDSQG